MGNIQVTLLPADAISADATWRVVGETTWHASSDSVSYAISSYPQGCTLEFSRVAGWRTPQTRTLTLADGNTTTSTATYHNSTYLVADSYADFSLVQGSKDWYYGFYYPYNVPSFYPFSLTGSDAYGSLWYQGGTARVWAAGAHPETSVQTVRRWVSNIDSEANISGVMWKLISGGNGFFGFVGINGALQVSNTIAGTNTTGIAYSFNTRLASGDNVDFFVDAAGDASYDHCGFIGTIKVPMSTGSLRVNIQPAGAVAAGAKWRRQGTAQWFTSGETEYDIAVGDYCVEFADATNWGTPARQMVTIAADLTKNITSTYLPMGDIKVNIMPALAVTQKGQWRPVGTAIWHNSGDSVRFAVGNHSIEFKDIIGWKEPMKRTITVSENQTTQTIATYHGGSVVAWGNNDYGQCNPAAPNSEYVAVSGGYDFAVGLKSDGSVTQWGQIGGIIPSPNSDFTAISCGNWHTVGLKSDGSAVCWANNIWGSYSGQCNMPSPNSGFTAISSSAYNSLGLKSDGSIVCWGDNTDSQRIVPAPNSGFVSVAGGGNHFIGLKSDGTIVCWGTNKFGERDIPSPNSGFKAVACGNIHSLSLKTDGGIVCWGDNYYGECTAPTSTDFVSVAGDGGISIALRTNGSVAVWGNGTAPIPNEGFLAVDVGPSFYFAIKKTDAGSLTVTIAPTEAAAAGTKWRRAGTSTWFASGETEYDIPVGDYTIELSDLPGWTKPSPTVTITADQNMACTATYIAPDAIALPNAKKSADGTPIRITGAIVSAAWPDVFYIEADNRASGIRVEKTAHGLICGKLADVVGILGTNADGERFIQASTAISNGDGDVKPLGMTNKLIGGGSLLDSVTGIGQMGVLKGFGLNNIGLLVRTFGRVVEIEQVIAPALPTWFIIDDGSDAQVKCIVPDGVSINSEWDYVSVTGISSCEKDGTDIIRLVRIRKIDDVASIDYRLIN
ncbi:MAG: hypothetical protein ABFD46_10975 [Armatimonadota bacterium]